MPKILPFDRSYWVIPSQLLMGETPTSIEQEKTQEKLIGLKECGIKTVINLMEKEEKNNEGILFEDYIPSLKEWISILLECLLRIFLFQHLKKGQQL